MTPVTDLRTALSAAKYWATVEAVMLATVSLECANFTAGGCELRMERVGRATWRK